MLTGLKRIGLALSLMAFLFSLYPLTGCAESRPVLDVEYHFGIGYRKDNLNWNIAGRSDGTNPNILSELIWSNIVTLQLKGHVRAVLYERIYFRGGLQGGPILGGKVQDSDFHGDNRTQEFLRSENASDTGNVWDASGGIGYRTAATVFSGSLEVIPLVGFSFHKQNLTLSQGVLTIPDAGSFTGLDSSYSARWHGPWLGLDISYAIADLIVRASAEYHFFYYMGLANWNLRTDFAHPTSFGHTADGFGVFISTAIEYALRDDLRLSLDFEYSDAETDPGKSRTFFADGRVVQTQLNVVNWDSASTMLALSWSF